MRALPQIALVAQLASLDLDEDRSRLYCDLILISLSEAARRAFHTMDPAKYEYQSDFAKRYVAQGRAEGEALGCEKGERLGRAAIVIRLLSLRFGPLSDEIRSKLVGASSAELDSIGERLLTVSTLQGALEPE